MMTTRFQEGRSDMHHLKADLSLCEGYANCVVGAPDHFDLDDDGLVTILREEIPESALSEVEAAARSCPVSALTLEEM